MTTSVTKLTRLGTSETLSAFGELFTLVYNNGMQQSAILMPKIQRLSEKAQNQIYGRFYQASHPLEKDPAKGRELLSKNGDFIGLASKFLEVKTDIELSAKIYKLFQENAPIKTILPSYKKLSSASRKEIEEHLGMTAAEAAPKALETALVKVFDGMGACNGDAEAASSSQAISPSSPQQKPLNEIEKRVVALGSVFRKDYDTLNKAKDLLEAPTKDTDEKYKIFDLFEALSPYAQLLIEQRFRAVDPELPRENFMYFTPRLNLYTTQKIDVIKGEMLAVLHAFAENKSRDYILKYNAITDRLGKLEKIMLNEYLGYPRLIAHPYLAKSTTVNQEIFQRSLVAQYRKDMGAQYCPTECEDFFFLDTDRKEYLSKFDQEPDIQLYNQLPAYVTPSKNDTKGFLTKYAGLPDDAKKLFKGYCEDSFSTLLKSASAAQLLKSWQEMEEDIKFHIAAEKGFFTKQDFFRHVIPLSSQAQNQSNSGQI